MAEHAHMMSDEQLAEIGRRAVRSLHEHAGDAVPTDVRAIGEVVEVALLLYGRCYELAGERVLQVAEFYEERHR